MLSLYFGLPGCGKTTMLTSLAYKASFSKKSPYKHIYGNISLTGIPRYYHINADMLGKYLLEDCLILIDEGTLCFDSRDYKNFSKNLVSFFMLHRHYKADIVIFAQTFGAVDKKIRLIADRCYYMFKSPLTGWYKSIVWRIPYGIVIPSKSDTGSDKYGEIVEGYYKPSLLLRILTPNLKRKKYYPYFDSWERPKLDDLPLFVAENQHKHNKYSYDNAKKELDNCPKWKFFKRIRLKNFLKNCQIALDKI